MLRQLVLGATLAGLLAANPSGAFAQKAGALPAVAKKPVVKKIRDKRIERYRQHYARKKAQGRHDVPSARKVAVEQGLRKQAMRLKKALEGKKPDKPVLIILEGADGAGKSSTIRRLLPAFEGARKVSVTHHGAPEAGSDAVQQVMRYFEKVPVQGSVMIWDRSWYGPTRYADDNSLRTSTKDQKSAIRDVRHIEGLLKDKVQIVKIYLGASKERQAKTLGKREALAPEKLSEYDYIAYKQHDQMKMLDKNAIARTGKHVKWNVIDMNDRGAGRKQLFELLHKELIGD